MDNFKKWASIKFPLWARLAFTIIVGGSIFAWARLAFTIIVGGSIFAWGLPTLLIDVLPRLDKTLHLPSLHFGLVNQIVGWAFLAVGIFFAIWSIGQQLFTAQGTPIPVMATQKLIIRGVFKYCRNPMGFGAICMYLGCAILAGSICSLLTVILFGGLFVLYIKKVEEKELILRFGAEYEEYKKTTPFIIPFLSMERAPELEKKRPHVVTVFLVLSYLVALVWLIFGMSIVTGLHPTMRLDSLVSSLIAIVSLLAAVWLFILTYFTARHSKPAYWLLLITFILLTIASLLDELGVVDIVVFAVTAITLGCLIYGRRWFLLEKDK